MKRLASTNIFTWVLLSSCLLGLEGCRLSRPALTSQSFAFQPVTPRAAPHRGPWLQIRRVAVAATFDSQSFIYRTGDLSYERDPYAQFLVPPAELVQAALQESFAQDGAFQGVLAPGSDLTPDVLAEASVDDLYGDFRNRTAPAAVLAMSFIFFDASNGLAGQVLLQKNYERRIHLQARTAAALMAGWNEALKQITGQVETDWREKHGPPQ